MEFRDSSGRKVSSKQFFDNIKKKGIELAMSHLEERARNAAGSLIDPETGKHSVVFVRRNGENKLVVSTKGSPAYARELERRLGVDRGSIRSMTDDSKKTTPVVYLAHGSPDHETLARPLAEYLMENGIDVWFDEWEIDSGDSIRQKMDQGLGDCTHFLVLLTPGSIGRPWVETEIDAGFVGAVEGRCKFVGLRIGVEVSELSPFLRSRRCPEIDISDKAALEQLAAEVYGISRKPERGATPRYVKTVPSGLQFWSQGAIAVAEHLVRESKNGVKFDPQTTINKISEALEMPETDTRLAVLDLEEAGLVERSGEHPSGRFWPTPSLFVEFDRHFLEFDNEEDAIAIANWLVSNDVTTIGIDKLAKNFADWPPRRLNSALNYLEDGTLVRCQHTLNSAPWAMRSLTVTDRTHRFARDNG